MDSDELYGESNRKPVDDERVKREVVAKSGESALEEWVFSAETWEEVMEFVREHGGVAQIEVPDGEDGLGALLLLGG